MKTKLLFILSLSLGIQAYAQSDKIIAIPFGGGAIEGTLTEKDSTNRSRVVLLIAGSGPTDRDGNSFIMGGKNNSLKYLAEDLTNATTAVFRYDKPGIGKSKISIAPDEMVFEDMVNGALACVKHLKSIGFSQVIIAGHSEGSLIGMLASVEANGFISLLGPCQRAGDILKDQLKSYPDELYMRVVEKIDSLSLGFPVANDVQALNALFNESVQTYLMSWMQYAPCEVLKKVEVPVLIVQGKSDLQVPVSEGQCLAACRPDATYSELEYMNHVLKIVTDEKENKESYSNPSFDLHPSLIPVIESFFERL